MSIRIRIILSFVLVVGVGFYFLVDRILEDLRPRYLEAVEETLVDQANVLAAWLETEMKGENIHTENLREAFQKLGQRKFAAQIYQMLKTGVDERVYILDSQGKVIFDSHQGEEEGNDFSNWNDFILTMKGEYGARTTRQDPKNPTTSVLHVGAPIRFEDRIVGVLTVAKPTASINFFIQTARPKIMIAGSVAALSVILLGIVLSAWVTQPIQRLTRFAQAVRDGKRVKLPELGKSEIAQMGEAFEEMREALVGKNYVEHYVQTLTHELKSPLSAIQGAAEILSGEVPQEKREHFIKNIELESRRMKTIVERMLQLSALEGRQGLQDIEEINLAEAVEEVRKRMEPTLGQRGQRITVNIPKNLKISGERFLIEMALQNLIQNALDFNAPGGVINVEARTEGGKILLDVNDEGPGIPDYALPKVFDRFYSLPRPGNDKKSSGLGLSFVQEVANLHQGEIKITNRSPRGACARLIFPLLVK